MEKAGKMELLYPGSLSLYHFINFDNPRPDEHAQYAGEDEPEYYTGTFGATKKKG